MWVINKRVARNIKSNIAHWAAIILLIMLGVYLIVSFLASSAIMLKNNSDGFTDYKGRQGRFTTAAELSDEEISYISDLGLDIQNECCIDYYSDNDHLIRIWRNRDKVDLVFCDKGRIAESDDEIVIEKIYAKLNGIKIGDSVNVGGVQMTVCGIGGSIGTQYLYSDSVANIDTKSFGSGYVTDAAYRELSVKGNRQSSETYRYSYIKHSSDITDQQIEDRVKSIEFDTSRITDRFFIEMLDELTKTKVDLENTISDLNQVCKDLDQASGDFDNGTKEVNKAAKAFNEGVDELVSGIRELNDGAKELTANSKTLRDGADTIFNFVLSNSQSQLRDNGINVTLTKDNYKTVLSQVDTGSLSSEAVNMVSTVEASLSDIETFYNGVLSYTEGVDTVAGGSGQLSSGMDQLKAASDQIKAGISTAASAPELGGMLDPLDQNYQGFDASLAEARSGAHDVADGLNAVSANSSSLRGGARQVFQAVLDTASSQLRSAGINEHLSIDSYASQLQGIRSSIGGNTSAQAQASVNELIATLDSFNQFYTGLNAYIDGTDKLKDGINELYEATPELAENSKALYDSSNDFVNYSRDLKDGTADLREGVSSFSENMDELDEFFDFDITLLTGHIPLTTRTGLSITAESLRTYGVIIGWIVLAIVIYVLTVFISRDIEEESAVIGTLYSMGVKKRELLAHYCVLPVVLSFIGGVIGTLLGYSPIGVKMQLSVIGDLYSVPELVSRIDPAAVAAGVLGPPILALIITILVVNKRLSRSPLSLLRHEKKIKRIRNIESKKLSFLSRFRIKQMISESGTCMVVFVGLFFSVLLLTIAMDMGLGNMRLADSVRNTTSFDTMTMLRYAPEEVPEGCETAYAESYDIAGFDESSVTVIGIADDSEQFPFSVKDNKENSVLISTAIARKFGMHKGGRITLYNDTEHRYYTFDIAGTADFTGGLYMFMRLDDMRSYFGQKDDYYNVLFSQGEADTESGRIAGVITKESLIKSADTQVSTNRSVAAILLIVAALTFVVIVYLMIKLMIDKVAMNISLMKVMGYHRKEIKKLYIDGNFYVVLISALIAVPLCKSIVDGSFHDLFMSSISYGLDLHFEFYVYILLIAVILLLYFAVTLVIRRRIDKISLSDILKNRE